jgi:uncharacterized protein (DUF1501 family)
MSEIPGVDTNRVLVVIQLSGGNDGLNTVIPYADDAYYRVRPAIGIPRNQVLTLSGAQDVGLHPRLAEMMGLYDEGACAVVQGVGYPNPNRSHFKSMDIWQTADTSGTGDGWIGRYFDAQCCGYGKGESGTAESAPSKPGAIDPSGMPGIAVGREAPLAMLGQKVKPIAFENENLFRWIGEDVHDSLPDPYSRITRRGVVEGTPAESNASFLMRTALDAQVSSETIRQAVNQQSLVQYPNSGLARQLAMVASMIRAGLPTRVYYVSHGGFDTHAGQGGPLGNHANLLGQFAQAVNAFYRDLQAQGNDSRVLTMSFSEFGRRVAQNASAGTDHGTAAPMYLFGPMIKPGVHGRHPSLTDLDNGDLKFHTDFRSVYADILENWMQADSKAVLEATFRPTKILKT